MALTRITGKVVTDGSITPSDLSTGAPTWDASGNLTATSFVGNLSGNVTGNVSGNATTATKFASAPAFSAWQSSAQAMGAATTAKINLQTEEYDTNNAFDNATNFRFTPQVAGYYQINGAIGVATSSSSMWCAIYKNGVTHKVGAVSVAANSVVSSLVYLNGTTDYVELYGQVGTAQNLNAGANVTYFNGVLVKPA